MQRLTLGSVMMGILWMLMDETLIDRLRMDGVVLRGIFLLLVFVRLCAEME